MLESDLFQGTHFWGSEHLPEDLLLGVENIRRWAIEMGMAFPDDFEDEELVVEDVRKVFASDDKLSILVSIEQGRDDKLAYIEYPFVPIRTLIKKNLEVSLVYWTLLGHLNEETGYRTFNKVRFGFDISGCWNEFASESTSKNVVPKFVALHEELGEQYATKTIEASEGWFAEEIQVDGDVSASFSRVRTAFDVLLSMRPDPNN